MKLLVINEKVLDGLKELGLKINPETLDGETFETIGGIRFVVNDRIPDNQIWGVNQDQIRAYNERHELT